MSNEKVIPTEHAKALSRKRTFVKKNAQPMENIIPIGEDEH